MWSPSPWVAAYDPSAFGSLPYDVASQASLESYLGLARQRNIGWIYVTDDGGANPWDRLPAYWTTEVSDVQAVNASSIPTLSIMGMALLLLALAWSGAALACRQ